MLTVLRDVNGPYWRLSPFLTHSPCLECSPVAFFLFFSFSFT